MSIALTDAPEDASSSDFAPANPELAESPPTDSVTPPSPEDFARDNARSGRWAMNEYFDGCILLGADDKPVMRNDGSRVGFFFRDALRLADELAAGSAPSAVPSENDADSRVAVWRAHRRALALLDSGFNKDWDPQRPKSTLADMTKWTRLLAYYYVQTTEPEEAVRRAVSDIFGKPLNGPRMRVWVPSKYNVDTIKAVTDAMFSEAVGPEMDETLDTEGENASEGAAVPVNDGTPSSVSVRITGGGDLNPEDIGPGEPRENAGQPGSPLLTDTARVSADGQSVVDAIEGDPGHDSTGSVNPSGSSLQPPHAERGADSQFFARILEPIARLSVAAAQQYETIASGTLAPDKLLAPAMAIRESGSSVLNDPLVANLLMGYGGIKGVKTSLVNRAAHRTFRENFWRLEAKENVAKYSAENIARMQRRKAPIGSDGHPMELHHVNQTHEGGVKVMTRTDHRLGTNFRKNHPKREEND
jgi:hypothetical protein